MASVGAAVAFVAGAAGDAAPQTERSRVVWGLLVRVADGAAVVVAVVVVVGAKVQTVQVAAKTGVGADAEVAHPPRAGYPPPRRADGRGVAVFGVAQRDCARYVD